MLKTLRKIDRLKTTYPIEIKMWTHGPAHQQAVEEGIRNPIFRVMDDIRNRVGKYANAAE